ncbi:UMP-CMP kinase [Rhodofomes roseus]|uniref:UMP-CMP kinase n=1 Tax=Rhodofomes roseus TaxID=34475 RepID=A0ABQ8K331_9APHY|nr:UMP-CMP kinase [Rhodofomes roseus]KAH9830973.1 UMP-CMP kinase [Rhodofomes roseus]
MRLGALTMPILDKLSHALHLDKNKKDKKDKKAAEKASEPESSKPATEPPASTSANTEPAPSATAEPASATLEAAPATTDEPVPAMSAEEKTRVFDKSGVTVIFVLGGPGVGKGTQCANLVNDFGFCHLSGARSGSATPCVYLTDARHVAGDLLRAEQNREGSEYGEMIRTYIKEGQIVPMEVTIKLLENAMKAALAEGRSGEGWADGKGRFLIDGFPRKMDQAEKFDDEVCECSLVLFFTTTEEEMSKRLLKRGETSGREDDNAESIKKRLLVYQEKTMPVIEHYTKLHKVASIDASATIEEVHQKAKAIVEGVLSGAVSRNITA